MHSSAQAQGAKRESPTTKLDGQAGWLNKLRPNLDPTSYQTTVNKDGSRSADSDQTRPGGVLRNQACSTFGPLLFAGPAPASAPDRGLAWRAIGAGLDLCRLAHRPVEREAGDSPRRFQPKRLALDPCPHALPF